MARANAFWPRFYSQHVYIWQIPKPKSKIIRLFARKGKKVSSIDLNSQCLGGICKLNISI